MRILVLCDDMKLDGGTRIVCREKDAGFPRRGLEPPTYRLTAECSTIDEYR